MDIIIIQTRCLLFCFLFFEHTLQVKLVVRVEFKTDTNERVWCFAVCLQSWAKWVLHPMQPFTVNMKQPCLYLHCQPISDYFLVVSAADQILFNMFTKCF